MINKTPEQKAAQTAAFEKMKAQPGYQEALQRSISRMAAEIEAKTYVGKDGKRYVKA